ncbi:hypothetical protein EXIGLDRAFT_588937, partial [Exidia glandulosa HHB12029]
GLFSGVTTTFIIESYTLLEPDFGELTYRALVANATNPAPSDRDFVVPPTARVVNCLWITSLMFSLSAALVAVMGAEWSAAYHDPATEEESESFPPLQRAERRHFRFQNSKPWGLPIIILTAPMLMQISLLLFAIGLALFFVPIDHITA